MSETNSEGILPHSNDQQKDVSQLYDELQQRGFYDDKLGGNETHAGRLVVHAVQKNAESVLEIGPATGLQIKQILDARPSVRRATAVEIAPEMVAKLRVRLQPMLEARSGQLMMIEKPIQDAWGEIQPHDVVISSYVGAYVGDIPAYIDHLYQLVKPGGTLIYIDAVEPSPPLTGMQFIFTSLVMLFWSHLKEGLILSPGDLKRSMAFGQVEGSPQYRALSKFHTAYHFPIEAWHSTAQKYHGRVIHTAPIAAIMICPK